MPDAIYMRAPLTSERSEASPVPSPDGVGIAPEGPSRSVSGRPGTARATETAPERNPSPDPVLLRLAHHLEQTASLLALAVTQRDDALLEAKRARADAHAQANLNVELLDKLAAVRRYADECRVRTGAQLDALTVAATLRGLVGEGK